MAHAREKDTAFRSHLRNHFRLDQDGETIWRLNRNSNEWQTVAAKPDARGYKRVGIWNFLEKEIRVLYHRLVWFLYHDEFPKDFIDHIDRNTSNNHIANLRNATLSENAHNCYLRQASKRGSSSSFLGVAFNKRVGRFQAYIGVECSHIHLGYFDNQEDAAKARDAYVLTKGLTHRYKLNFNLAEVG